MSSKTERELRSARLAEIRDKWVNAGLTVDQADRPQANTAVETLYRRAGLRTPRLEWCGGPQALIRLMASDRLQSLDRIVGTIDQERRTPVMAEWYGLVDWAEAGSVRDAVSARVWRDVGSQVADHAWTASGPGSTLVGAARAPARNPLSGFAQVGLYGQHDAASMALHEVLRDIQQVITPSETLDALAALSASAGWCVPLDGVCLLAERHSGLKLDSELRLHAEGGPALEYPDGLALFAWHGTVVPEQAIRDPDWITPERIERETDGRVKRTLIELHGFGSYLQRADARMIHEDQTGRLWSKTFATGSAWLVVEVENGTPEPDGSNRHYYLRVPPTMRTAREAVAWTYGLGAREYELIART